MQTSVRVFVADNDMLADGERAPCSTHTERFTPDNGPRTLELSDGNRHIIHFCTQMNGK